MSIIDYFTINGPQLAIVVAIAIVTVLLLRALDGDWARRLLGERAQQGLLQGGAYVGLIAGTLAMVPVVVNVRAHALAQEAAGRPAQARTVNVICGEEGRVADVVALCGAIRDLRDGGRPSP